MKKYPILIAELPYSKGIGGHCTLVSDAADGEDGKISNILGIARDQDRYTGDTFLSMSRDSIQASSGRNVRDVVVLLNVETSRFRPDVVEDLFARLRSFLDQFKELQEEMDQKPLGRASTIVVSGVLRRWLSTMEGLEAAPKTTPATAATPGRNDSVRKIPHLWIALALTIVIGIGAGFVLWDRFKPLERHEETIVPKASESGQERKHPTSSGKTENDNADYDAVRKQVKQYKSGRDIQSASKLVLDFQKEKTLSNEQKNTLRNDIADLTEHTVTEMSKELAAKLTESSTSHPGREDVRELRMRFAEAIIAILPPDRDKQIYDLHTVFRCDSEEGKNYYEVVSKKCYSQAVCCYYSAVVTLLRRAIKQRELDVLSEKSSLTTDRLFSGSINQSLLSGLEDEIRGKCGLNKLLPGIGPLLKKNIKVSLRLRIPSETADAAFGYKDGTFSIEQLVNVAYRSNEANYEPTGIAPHMILQYDKKLKTFTGLVDLTLSTHQFLKTKEIEWRGRKATRSKKTTTRIVFTIDGDLPKTTDSFSVISSSKGEVEIENTKAKAESEGRLMVSGSLFVSKEDIEELQGLDQKLGTILLELTKKR